MILQELENTVHQQRSALQQLQAKLSTTAATAANPDQIRALTASLESVKAEKLRGEAERGRVLAEVQRLNAELSARDAQLTSLKTKLAQAPTTTTTVLTAAPAPAPADPGLKADLDAAKKQLAEKAATTAAAEAKLAQFQDDIAELATSVGALKTEKANLLEEKKALQAQLAKAQAHSPPKPKEVVKEVIKEVVVEDPLLSKVRPLSFPSCQSRPSSHPLSVGGGEPADRKGQARDAAAGGDEGEQGGPRHHQGPPLLSPCPMSDH